MRIAVIGDYESPGYKDLLQLVKIIFPEEDVIDLSRHQSGEWKKRSIARYLDIESAHRVMIGNDWSDHFDTKSDITNAQKLSKEIFIEFNGRFLPFPQNAVRI